MGCGVCAATCLTEALGLCGGREGRAFQPTPSFTIGWRGKNETGARRGRLREGYRRGQVGICLACRSWPVGRRVAALAWHFGFMGDRGLGVLARLGRAGENGCALSPS